jgi:ABC-type nitrate/sulfonate/bicarbonate transport system permease component
LDGNIMVQSSRAARAVLPPLVLLVLGLGLWEWRGRNSTVFPGPVRVGRALWRTRAVLPAHIATTLAETGWGVLIGVLAGLAIAGLVTLSPVLYRAIQPFLLASQAVPVLVLGPLLVLVLGFGLGPKVVVVTLVVLFPVAIATAAGLRQADAEMLELVRSYGASRWQQLRHVLGPAALPGALAGLQISLTYAVAGAVIGEGIGGTSGLGKYIDRSYVAFRYDQVLAGVVVVVVLSVVLFGSVRLLDRVLCPWRRREDKEIGTKSSPTKGRI